MLILLKKAQLFIQIFWAFNLKNSLLPLLYLH